MIALVFISNFKYCPYLSKYLDVINKSNQKYRLIYWNRDLDVINSNEYNSVFNYNSELNSSKFYKMKGFLKFRKFLKKELTIEKYDKVILLSTLSGMIIFDVLLKKFKNKYIFDIRDYSFEDNFIFKFLERKVVNYSDFTAISSPGFYNFLPKSNKYINVHNFKDSDLKNAMAFAKKGKNEPLVISHMGMCRDFELSKELIDRFGNDERFILKLCGDGPEFTNVLEYANKKQYSNIYVTGRYDGNDKFEIIKKSDLICNYYLYSRINECAVSNKNYDSLIFKRPSFANKRTYHAKFAEESHTGIGIDLSNTSSLDELYDFYHSLDENTFINDCNEYMKGVLKDDKLYKKKIQQFVLK